MELIASTDDLKHLADQLANDKEIKIHDPVIHFHPTDLPLTTETKGIHDNQYTLTQILLKLASSATLRSLSLLSQSAASPIHDKADRFRWKIQNLSPDLVALLSLQQYAGPGRRKRQIIPPALRVSGLSEVPAHVMNAWMSNSSSLSLENVSLDFATVIDLQQATSEDGGSRPSVAPAQSSLRHLSLKLKPLELAQFVHFHRQVLGETSPMYGVESLELWTSGVLKNEEMFLQFFGSGKRTSPTETLSSGLKPEFKNLKHLTFYKIYDKMIHGENPAVGPLTFSSLNLNLIAPALQTLSMGTQLFASSISDVIYHRKVIRAVLKETSLHIFQRKWSPKPLESVTQVDFVFEDGYNIGSDSLKYHAAQFVEMFRDALQRPGHRVESFERLWPVLEKVRIVLKGDRLRTVTEEEMKGFEGVKEELERIGEGRPSFHIVLDVDETGKS